MSSQKVNGIQDGETRTLRKTSLILQRSEGKCETVFTFGEKKQVKLQDHVTLNVWFKQQNIILPVQNQLENKQGEGAIRMKSFHHFH